MHRVEFPEEAQAKTICSDCECVTLDKAIVSKNRADIQNIIKKKKDALNALKQLSIRFYWLDFSRYIGSTTSLLGLEFNHGALNVRPTITLRGVVLLSTPRQRKIFIFLDRMYASLFTKDSEIHKYLESHCRFEPLPLNRSSNTWVCNGSEVEFMNAVDRDCFGNVKLFQVDEEEGSMSFHETQVSCVHDNFCSNKFNDPEWKNIDENFNKSCFKNAKDVWFFINSVDCLEICPICTNNITNIYKTACNHNFCRLCIQSWVKTKLNCPVCRKFLSYDF